jgi:hypothetical protein
MESGNYALMSARATGCITHSRENRSSCCSAQATREHNRQT